MKITKKSTIQAAANTSSDSEIAEAKKQELKDDALECISIAMKDLGQASGLSDMEKEQKQLRDAIANLSVIYFDLQK